jgi:hypothetical protein
LPLHIAESIAKRTAREDVTQSLMGALLYLDDMQIRPRPSKQSSVFDACGEGDGCTQLVHFNVPFLNRYAPMPVGFPKIRNEVGEWASTIHFMPVRMGDAEGESMLVVQDSNVFMTAAIAYPMYLFSEKGLAAPNRIVSEMRELAVGSVARYRRGDSFNFWLERPGVTSSSPRTGPYNIPVAMIEQLARAYVNPLMRGMWGALGRDLDLPSQDWIKTILNREKNPSGADAAFNIPNDADDTSVAVALQTLQAREQAGFPVDRDALRTFGSFRDLSRSREDGRDGWKGKDSGAFLTWLKNEDEGVFARPETGVIPLGVNNVDCVVNANVLFATGLAGTNDIPGIAEAAATLKRAVDSGEWKRKCGLYYPQLMIFPYTLSRAFRDGGRTDGPLRATVATLLPELIGMQRGDGSFPGGKDKTSELSTALALTAMLNIGVDVARERGIESGMRRAIDRAIVFLVEKRQEYKIVHQDTFDRSRARADEQRVAYRWQSGMFFSASFWDLAQWRSEAYTVSIVTEALAKYLLAYDEGRVDVASGRRIAVSRYALSAANSASEFKFEVK